VIRRLLQAIQSARVPSPVHRDLDLARCPSTQHAPATSDDQNRRLDLYLTIVMSVAALATSWGGYQASVWSGDQASHGGAATALRTTSMRASTRAGQERIVDVQLFTSWLGAYATGNRRLATFYEERFRPEFVPAFRVWVASRPLRSPDAVPTPFTLPQYRIASDAEAQRLASEADQESAASQFANTVSDGYVLDAVILAMVMFFATAAQRVLSARLRLVCFIIALAMCAFGVYRLCISPLA
jgi:hypothetical protein